MRRYLDEEEREYPAELKARMEAERGSRSPIVRARIESAGRRQYVIEGGPLCCSFARLGALTTLSAGFRAKRR